MSRKCWHTCFCRTEFLCKTLLCILLLDACLGNGKPWSHHKPYISLHCVFYIGSPTESKSSDERGRYRSCKMKGRTDSFTHLSRVPSCSWGATWKGMGPWLLTSLELLNQLWIREKITQAEWWFHFSGTRNISFLSYQELLPSTVSSWVMAPAASQDQLCYFVSRQFFYGHFLPILGRRICLPHKIIYQTQQLASRIFWDVTPVCRCTQCKPNTHCPFIVLCLGDWKNSQLSPSTSHPNSPSTSQPLLHLFLSSSCLCLLLHPSVGSQATSSAPARVSTVGFFPVLCHPLLQHLMDQLIYKSQWCGSVMGKLHSTYTTQHAFSLMS